MRAILMQLGFKAAPGYCLVAGENKWMKCDSFWLAKRREIRDWRAHVFTETCLHRNILGWAVALDGRALFGASRRAGWGDADCWQDSWGSFMPHLRTKKTCPSEKMEHVPTNLHASFMLEWILIKTSRRGSVWHQLTWRRWRMLWQSTY